MSKKLAAGSPMPELDLPLAGGGRVRVGGVRQGFQLVIVYRGKHCPLCKTYLKRLNEMQNEFGEANAELVAISADSQAKAEADVAEHEWRFPVAYDLGMEDMRRLGLYISEPRNEQETDRPFSEPAAFLVNPGGQVQVIDISNAPWSRPDLGGLLRGIRRIQEVDYPIRGTLA